MNESVSRHETHDLTKMAVVASLYVVLTFVTAPIAYGPLNFRIAEGLNFLSLYHRKYILAVAVGVFLSNYFAYGVLDMMVGSFSTLIFLYIGRWIANQIVDHLPNSWTQKFDTMLIKYVILTIIFSLSMITIALMVKFLGTNVDFLTLYGGLVLSEMIAMTLGGLIIYPISKKFNFYK